MEMNASFLKIKCKGCVYIDVVCLPKQHPTKIQTNMTLPSYPTQFLAHCKAHKSLTQSQPCKELKMPALNPPTPADGTTISLTQGRQLKHNKHPLIQQINYNEISL